MGKFSMRCPKCSHYVTAYNGIMGFFKKKVACGACGEKFDVDSERMISVLCPHCEQPVLYDQGEKNPKCPVCNKEIRPGEGQRLVTVKCPTCGVGMEVTEGASAIHCHICDTVIDVQRELGKAAYAKSGLVSTIKYEGDNNTFVWKHPIEDFNTGSQLIVHESQEAIFFRDGQALDLFGPGRHVLETQNLPLLEKVYKLPTNDPAATFHSEVYFINMATQMGLKWGTDSKIYLFEPMTGMHVGIGASGEFNIRVVDSRKVLLKLVGTTNGLVMKPDQAIGGADGQPSRQGYSSDIPAANRYLRSLIMTEVKSYLASVIEDEAISVFNISRAMADLSVKLRDRINENLEEYGLTMPEFRIMRFLTPDNDDDGPERDAWLQAKSLFAQRYTNVEEQRVAQKTAEAEREKLRVQAETEAEMQAIKARGAAEALRIQRAAEADAYRMQAEAEAAEMRMKGYTYQQETSRQIGMEAMKNGLTGGSGAGGAIGDIAGLGITLGAMGGVMGMAKEAMQPLVNGASGIGQTVGGALSGAWDCPACGTRQIASKCCPECGARRPEPAEAWNCPVCGTQGLTSKCCPECGAKRPEASADNAWNCPACGAQGLTSKCCPECGARRPEQPALWDCPACGAKGIRSKFCPECGHRRGE